MTHLITDIVSPRTNCLLIKTFYKNTNSSQKNHFPISDLRVLPQQVPGTRAQQTLDPIKKLPLLSGNPVSPCLCDLGPFETNTVT